MPLKLYVDKDPVDLKVFTYSGGEVSTKFDIHQTSINFNYAYIRASLQSSDDIMALLMLTDSLRRVNPSVKIKVGMEYVPYARQDRVCASGESLSIKVFCDLINSQKYDSILISDPHSEVTPALLNNCAIDSQAEIFAEGMKYNTMWGKGKYNLILVSPDAGATKKINDLSKATGIHTVVRADKTRDVNTGEITGTVVYSDFVGNRDFIIVDDICDGGRTFLELAKVLRPLTTGKIILYVTHGIFSKGLEVFDGVIDEVYTANPWDQEKWKPFTNLVAIKKET